MSEATNWRDELEQLIVALESGQLDEDRQVRLNDILRDRQT